jgi:hypothetical protein
MITSGRSLYIRQANDDSRYYELFEVDEDGDIIPGSTFESSNPAAFLAELARKVYYAGCDGYERIYFFPSTWNVPHDS